MFGREEHLCMCVTLSYTLCVGLFCVHLYILYKIKMDNYIIKDTEDLIEDRSYYGLIINKLQIVYNIYILYELNIV